MMMHEDVVCNRSIHAGTTVWVSRYHDEPYFFCSLKCREQFELEPGDFLPAEKRSPLPAMVLLRVVS